MSVLKRWVIPGLVAVAATTGISLFSETSKIEADLTARAQKALEEAGVDWAGISFSGRDGALTGIAPEDGSAAKTIAMLEDKWGVRVVEDQTRLLPEQKPFTWGLERDGKKLSMFGYLPYWLAGSTPDYIKDQIPGSELASSVEAARGAPKNIDEALGLTAALIKELPNGKAMLIDNNLTISGKLEDGNAEHVTLHEKLTALVSSSQMGDIRVDLQIPAPKKPDPTAGMADAFFIKRTADGVDLSGLVPNQKSKDELLSLAKRKFGLDGVSDNLAIREGADIAGLSPGMFSEITKAALQAMSRLGEGEASLENGALSLNGGAFYEGALAQVKQFLKSALPGDFSFNSDLAVVAPGEAVDAGQCQQLLKDALSRNTILFDSGKASISTDSFGLLDGLIYTAHRCPESKIEVQGHTDSDGDDAANQLLSDRRAASVLTYLTKAGLATDRLTAKGFGESQPVASNDTAEGKAKNRRIEFVIMAQ